jgi:16S rRNA (guanine966-N2)-methyltransferase
MRVIAGSARGRRLVAPEGASTRPTGDRVREATFNALVSLGALEGAVVLDLFAGSGALGIEALSRGAERCTFVDLDRAARQAVTTNVATCGFATRATIVAGPADRHLAELGRTGEVVDLALLDPPYDFVGWSELFAALPADLAVVESGGPIDVPEGWERLRTKRYGRTTVAILERAGLGTR